MHEIKIDDRALNNVDPFDDLGSSLSSSNSLDKERERQRETNRQAEGLRPRDRPNKSAARRTDKYTGMYKDRHSLL